jgi:hypothetical protein
VRHTAVKGDGIEFGAARRLAAAAGVAAFAVFDDFSGALEQANFADTSDILSVPLHTEFEVLVRVEALRINAELSHILPPTKFEFVRRFAESG